MNTLADIRDQMIAAGMPPPPDHLVIGGFQVYGKKKRSWYSLHEVRTNSGASVIVGSFGLPGSGDLEKIKIEVDWKGIGAEEREAVRLKQEEAAKIEAIKTAEKNRISGLNARQEWHEGKPIGTSAYLQRKGVAEAAESVRYFADGSFMVPMIRYDAHDITQALVARQTIYHNGKKIMRGPKIGAACRLGLVAVGELILVCEGYATGLTIRMATDRRYPVFVAFDCGNISYVVQMLRKMYPSSPLLICADDDWQTKDQAGKPYNAGRIHSMQVAKATERCDVISPVWPYTLARGPKDTDFNDLMIACGLDAVRQQFFRVFRMIAKLENKNNRRRRA